MPSGAKRRKAAAKKKKEEPSGSEATGSFNGLEDLKVQESDGGEVSLHASQDPLESGGQTQSFTGKGGDRGRLPVRQIDSERDIVEEVVVLQVVGVVKVDEDEESLEITKELKFDDVFESTDLNVEICKSAEGSSNGSSSSSSSDDEMIDIEKTEVALDSAKQEQVNEVVKNAVDLMVPTFVVDDVIFVPEASPIEEPYEDLGKPVLSESNSEMKATTDEVLPANPPTHESHGESSNVGSYDVKDTDDKALPPSDSHITITDNGAGHLKDPEIHASVENQRPMLQAPLSVHRTSWNGCCGLFEVFTGSR